MNDEIPNDWCIELEFSLHKEKGTPFRNDWKRKFGKIDLKCDPNGIISGSANRDIIVNTLANFLQELVNPKKRPSWIKHIQRASLNEMHLTIKTGKSC